MTAVGHFAGSLGENVGGPRYASHDRLHHHPGAPSRGLRRGIQRNALGRSRGGFWTKIHPRTNAEGLPTGTTLTADEARDIKGYEALMIALMIDDAPDPKNLRADRGYESDAVRGDMESGGAVPMS